MAPRLTACARYCATHIATSLVSRVRRIHRPSGPILDTSAGIQESLFQLFIGKNFLFGQLDAAPVGRCGAATTHRATDPRTAWQTHDTRTGQSNAAAHGTKKERPDELISSWGRRCRRCRSCSHSCSNTHRQLCAPTAAHTRTARPQAAHFQRARPAHGSRRRSATRAPTTHNSAPLPDLLICDTAERRECTLGYDTSFTEWEPRCDNSR